MLTPALRPGRPIAALVDDGLSVEGNVQPGESNSRFNQTSYGAHFREARVHAVSGEVRVARRNSVFAAGRILNPQTATSQAIGGSVS